MTDDFYEYEGERINPSSKDEEVDDDAIKLRMQLSQNESLQAALDEAQSSLSRMALNWAMFAIVGLMVSIGAGFFVFAPTSKMLTDALLALLGTAAVAGVLIFIFGMLSYVRIRAILARSRVMAAGNMTAIKDGQVYLARLDLAA